MVFISHPNRIHETAVNLAEGSRQSGVAAAVAAGGGSAAVAAAVRAAEIIYYKAISLRAS